MFISIFLLLGFLNKSTMLLGSLFGGVGFGLFVDEIGKFVTKDNNYFYQPAVALVYCVFVVIYLVFNYLNKKPISTDTEYLSNAIEGIKHLYTDEPTSDRVESIRKLLSLAKQNLHSRLLAQFVSSISPKTPSSSKRITSTLKHLYHLLKISRSPRRLSILVTIYFSLHSLINLGQTIITTWQPRSGVSQWGEWLSTLVANGLVLFGLIRLRKSRLASYKILKTSILISIFITQIFTFYLDQLSALFGLAINLVSLIGINYLIDTRTKFAYS